MSLVTSNQPLGTPNWIDIGIPDLDHAMRFYGAIFGWDFEVGPEETGRYTMCFVHGKPVAAMMPNMDPTATEFWWNVYFATDDCDATAKRALDSGGTVLVDPMTVMEHGRMAIVKDPVGGQFGLWQGINHIGCQVVNEANTLLRNDLVTANPEPAREFYASVFDFTLDRDDNQPGVDFTFLRRPDGHEIGGIVGDSSATKSMWDTMFLVHDIDEAVRKAVDTGGSASTPDDTPYGRIVQITDPFGAEFTVGSSAE